MAYLLFAGPRVVAGVFAPDLSLPPPENIPLLPDEVAEQGDDGEALWGMFPGLAATATDMMEAATGVVDRMLKYDSLRIPVADAASMVTPPEMPWPEFLTTGSGLLLTLAPVPVRKTRLTGYPNVIDGIFLLRW